MLRVHNAVYKAGATPQAGIVDLWKGQANDTYWHGLFGGIYTAHMRSAIYHHLIKAENAADANEDSGAQTGVTNGFGFRGGRSFLGVFDQFDANHQAEAAYIADMPEFGRPLAHALHQVSAHTSSVLDQSFFEQSDGR